MAAPAGRVWHGVELRHFAALEAIARESSFSAAASSLGYTQSAISGQITTLERLVGATLFERLPGSRGVALTDEGRMLVEHAAAITSRLRAARADLEAMRNGSRCGGALRVGTFQSVSMTLLPKILSELAGAEPPLTPTLRELQDTAQLLELVARGDLDVTFTTLPLPPGPFEAVALMRDPYCLAVGSGSPLAARRSPIALEELEELPVIALERCLAQMLVEDGLRAAGVTPNIVTRLEDFASICALAEAELGVGLVPSLVASHLRGLTVLDLDDRAPHRILGLAWHADRLRAGSVEQLIRVARSVADRASRVPPVAAAP